MYPLFGYTYIHNKNSPKGIIGVILDLVYSMSDGFEFSLLWRFASVYDNASTRKIFPKWQIIQKQI